MISQCKKLTRALLIVLAGMFGSAVWADAARDEMQRRLNEQVMSKPFGVADEATLNESLRAATERGTPTKSPPAVVGRYGYYGGYYRPYYWGYANPYYSGYYGYRGYYAPYYRSYYWPY